MASAQSSAFWSDLRRPGTIATVGVVLAASRLLLLPFIRVLPTTWLSTLAQVGLSVTLVVVAWKASRRSSQFARVLWACVAFASVFWTISTGIGAAVLARHDLQAAFAAFWHSTVIFYLVAIVLALPLLLGEDQKRIEIDWLRAFDIAQLGIVSFCAYLVFVYIPLVTNSSEAARAHSFTTLHWLRDGFLAAGYFYRGWRSQTPALKRLQLGMSIFFLAFMGSGSLIGLYMKAQPWQIPLLDLVNDLPVVFLLLLAATWQQPAGFSPGGRQTPLRYGLFWAQVLPVALAVSVIAIASRITAQDLRIAWIAVAASVACYAGRLLVMQHRQQVAQSRLKITEEKLARAFRLSPAAITISRLSDGTYIDVNDRWLEMMHLRREEVIGKTSSELDIWTSSTDRKRLVDAIRETGTVRDMPFTFKMAGRLVPSLLSAELIDFDGQPVMIVTVLDVSELANATLQLRQAQKMELVGTFAGGIAHDFNNLLTVIKGYSELAQTHDLGKEVAHEIEEIGKAANKAAALTQQLLAFSRRQVLQPRNLLLNSLIQGIEPMFRRMIREDIELVFSLDSNIGTVHADPGQIEQVLLNLAANARDAMPDGGRLRFETRNLDLTTSYFEQEFEIPPGQYVMLAVSDTGMGIEPENLKRIFEPFFTTKEVGRGTGLGLSTVYGIVKQSGGFVWVYSELGSGTTFKICLPRVDRAVDASPVPGAEPEALGGEETVLLVEDDGGVRELAAKILSQQGYHVLVASNGAEAMSRSNEHSGAIHLLLTDVVMARTSGRQIAERLKQDRPKLKVIYMSGHPHSAFADESTVDFREAFLPKPFTPADLARRIRKTLDQD